MITEEEKQKLCEDYNNGMPVFDIYKKYNVSSNPNASNYLYKILSENKIEKRQERIKAGDLYPKINMSEPIPCKEITVLIPPIQYEAMEAFCKIRGISMEFFVKRYFSDYLFKMCEGLGIL